MSRVIVQSLLGLILIAVGGMLLTSSELLEYPLIAAPYLPVGTILTWLLLMALPALGWLLQHPGFLAGDEKDIPGEREEGSPASAEMDAARDDRGGAELDAAEDDQMDTGSDAADDDRGDAGSDAAAKHRAGFLRRLGEALCVAALMLAFLWPFVSVLLAGNLAFSFSRGRGATEILFGIFIGYTALTFLLGVLSLIASLRPGSKSTSSRRPQ